MSADELSPRGVGYAHESSESMRRLMWREARRAARSPILLVACAVAGWTMWGAWIDGQPPPNEWGADVYISLFHTAWPLLWGSFLLGAWTLARERPETTQELFTAAPLSAWQRTTARLAVAAVPAMAAVLVVGVQAFLVARAGGVPLGYPPYQVHVMPSPVEWASIPVAAFASYVGGAAAYTLTRSRTFTALIGTFVTLFGVFLFWMVTVPPAMFVTPIGVPVPEHDLTPSEMQWSSDGPYIPAGESQFPPWRLLDPDPALDAAHSVALLGMAAIFAALALERTTPDGRNQRLGWTGAAVVVLASLAQVLAYLL